MHRAAACSLFLALAVVAQQPLRESGFGRVTDRAGKAWVGAAVHLLHRAHPAVADPAFADAITAVTDDQGQFRVELLVGAAYVAWATGDGDAPALFRVTKVQPYAVTRTPILLLEDEPHYRRRLRPVPDPSWAGREPLRWRAVGRFGGLELAQWLAPAADGLLELPPWPVDSVSLQVWAGDWQADATWHSATTAFASKYGVQAVRGAELPDEAKARSALAATADVRVPARHARSVRLRDAATGAAVVDAEVRLDVQPFDVPAQRSDANGDIHAVFASDEAAPFAVPFSWCILPRDHAENRLTPSSWRQDDPPVVLRDLVPGTTVHGRLLLAEGEPAANVPLVLEATIGTSPTSAFFGAMPRVLVTDADGRFALPGRCEKFPYRLTAVLSPALRARLAGDQGGPIASTAVLRWLAGPEPLGDLVLERLGRLDLSVRQPDGTPPGATPVVLTRLGGQTELPCSPLRACTDHRGRLRVLLASTADVLVHCSRGNGAAWATLAADAAPTQLTLDVRHVVRFRVVDATGAAVPSAHLSLVGLTGHPAGASVAGTVSAMCSVHAFPHASATADAEGLGTMVLPLVGASYDFAVRSGGTDQRVHVVWDGPDGDAPLPIQLR